MVIVLFILIPYYFLLFMGHPHIPPEKKRVKFTLDPGKWHCTRLINKQTPITDKNNSKSPITKS